MPRTKSRPSEYANRDSLWRFRKVEPYLIFLNPVSLDRKCSDVQSKVDKLEMINQRLQERETINTDTIASLSDKLVRVIQEAEILKSEYNISDN